MTGPCLVAQLLCLMVVLPEDLLTLLQCPTVIVLLLPVLQRPISVCHKARVHFEVQIAALLHSCKTQAHCLDEQDSACQNILIKA